MSLLSLPNNRNDGWEWRIPMPLKGKMHVTFDTYTIIATITGPNNIFNQNKLNWVLVEN